MEFYEAINSLNNSNSRLYKEDKLQWMFDCDEKIKSLFYFTYNPEFVFNVKKFTITSSGEGSLRDDWNQCKYILLDLHHRVITGNAARDVVSNFASSLTKEDQEVFQNILKRDLRCNTSVATINKVSPNLIPEYPYMRCSLFNEKINKAFDWKGGILAQVKSDGMFVNVFSSIKDGFKITSRNGSTLPTSEFKDLETFFHRKMPANHVYHGELLVLQDGKVMNRQEGNGVLNSVLKGGSFAANQKPMLYLWDMVSEECYHGNEKGKIYEQRWYDLKFHIKHAESEFVKPSKGIFVYSLEEAMDYYKDCLSKGEEGAILKNPKGLWKDGTSKDQVKLKVEADLDLIVTGWNEGSGKWKGKLGSLICETSDGKLQVSVSGFKDEMREEIFQNLDSWIGKKIITVKSNALIKARDTEVARLFLPRFVEERLDKSEANSYNEAIEIFNSVLK